MMAQSAAIMARIKAKQGAAVQGETYKGKPMETLEQDIQMFTERFEKSTRKMKSRLSYFYGPYEQGRNPNEKGLSLSPDRKLSKSPKKTNQSVLG